MCAQEAPGLRCCPVQDALDLALADRRARRPLGHDAAGLDEELGAGGREGKRAAPQSARSPGVEVACDRVRCMRSW